MKTNATQLNQSGSYFDAFDLHCKYLYNNYTHKNQKDHS